MFHRPAPVIAPYSRGRVDIPATRQAAVVVAKLLLAAGYGALVVVLPPTMLPMLAVPIAVMLLLTLWMLPDRGVFPLGAIQRVYPVYLAFSILWPVYIAVALPGLPWMTPTRLLLFVLTFLLLYSVSTSGALRHHLLTVARASTAMWIAFLGWQAMQVITLPLSHEVANSVKIYFDNHFRLTGTFFLGCLLFTRPGWAARTICTLIVLAAITSIDGFVELKLEYPPWANHIPSFMRSDEALLSNVLGTQARTADGVYRVRGPFPNSLLFAEFLAICVPFVVHLGLTGKTFVRQMLMLAAFILIVAAIFVTQSRLGLVGVLATLTAYLPLWGWRQWRSGKHGLIGPSIVLGMPVVAAMVIVVVLSSTTLSHRVFGGGAQAASDEARKAQRQMAVPKILHNPIGYGLGEAGRTLNFVSTGGFITIDSGFITTVLDLGVVGFIAFYGLVLLAAWKGVRLFLTTDDPEIALAGPLAVSMLVFIIVKIVVSQENNHPLVFLLLGMQSAFIARQRGLVGADGTVALSARSGQETPMLAAAPASAARAVG